MEFKCAGPAGIVVTKDSCFIGNIKDGVLNIERLSHTSPPPPATPNQIIEITLEDLAEIMSMMSEHRPAQLVA
jgi:hypothetical protein